MKRTGKKARSPCPVRGAQATGTRAHSIPPTIGPTDIGSQWVQGGVTYTGKNFGMATFQVISLNASRVLSLASGDLIENDYSGGATNAHKDADIVLGADANGVKGFESRLDEKLGDKLHDDGKVRRGFQLYNPGQPTEGFTQRAMA